MAGEKRRAAAAAAGDARKRTKGSDCQRCSLENVVKSSSSAKPIGPGELFFQPPGWRFVVLALVLLLGCVRAAWRAAASGWRARARRAGRRRRVLRLGTTAARSEAMAGGHRVLS